VYATECLFARENDRIINGFVKRIFSILKKKLRRNRFFLSNSVKVSHSYLLGFRGFGRFDFCCPCDRNAEIRTFRKLQMLGHAGNYKCSDIPEITNARTIRQLQMLGHSGNYKCSDIPAITNAWTCRPLSWRICRLLWPIGR